MLNMCSTHLMQSLICVPPSLMCTVFFNTCTKLTIIYRVIPDRWFSYLLQRLSCHYAQLVLTIIFTWTVSSRLVCVTSQRHQYLKHLQSCVLWLARQVLTNTSSCRYFLGYKVKLQILDSKLLKLCTAQWPWCEYLTFATFQLLVCEVGQHRCGVVVAIILSEWQTVTAVIASTHWTLPL